jgi:hypothetical protein
MRWALPSQGWGGNVNVCRKLGVMFMEDNGNYGPTTQMPWNVRTTYPSFLDGTSSAILVRIRWKSTRTSTLAKTSQSKGRSAFRTTLNQMGVAWSPATGPCVSFRRRSMAWCTPRSSLRLAAGCQSMRGNFPPNRMPSPSDRVEVVSGKVAVVILDIRLSLTHSLTTDGFQGLATPITPTASRPPALPVG